MAPLCTNDSETTLGVKDDHAFMILRSNFPQILALCIVSCCSRNLEKVLGSRWKFPKRAKVKVLSGLIEKSFIFAALTTFHCQLSLFFW